MNQPVTMDDVAKYHLAESAAWQQIARDSQDSGQRESAQRKTDWHLQAAATVLQHIPTSIQKKDVHDGTLG